MLEEPWIHETCVYIYIYIYKYMYLLHIRYSCRNCHLDQPLFFFPAKYGLPKIVGLPNNHGVFLLKMIIVGGVLGKQPAMKETAERFGFAEQKCLEKVNQPNIFSLPWW